MSPLQYQITYSQNREDLILAGILRNVAVGFYVDVGANHPEFYSVTKLFYDKGWSGINIEPDEQLYAELSAQRPRDVNIRMGVSSQPGSLTFRSFPRDGISTFSSDLKRIYESAGWSGHRDCIAEVTTLSEVLRSHRPSGEIHFLKIDAEGLDLEVLLGNTWDLYRPWILCIEQTVSQSRQDAVTAFLAAWRYEKVFCDGINDYFVANERREVWANFSYGFHVLRPGIPVHSTYAAQRATAVVARDIARSPAIKHVKALLVLDGDAFVSAAYHTLLGRPPDPEGLRNYVQELNSGVSKLLIVSKLRNSNEGRRCRAPLAGYRGATIRRWVGL